MSLSVFPLSTCLEYTTRRKAFTSWKALFRGISFIDVTIAILRYPTRRKAFIFLEGLISRLVTHRLFTLSTLRSTLRYPIRRKAFILGRYCFVAYCFIDFTMQLYDTPLDAKLSILGRHCFAAYSSSISPFRQSSSNDTHLKQIFHHWKILPHSFVPHRPFLIDNRRPTIPLRHLSSLEDIDLWSRSLSTSPYSPQLSKPENEKIQQKNPTASTRQGHCPSYHGGGSIERSGQ